MNLSHFKSLQTKCLSNGNWKRSEFTNKTADFSRFGKAKRFRTVLANVLISRLNHFESDSQASNRHTWLTNACSFGTWTTPRLYLPESNRSRY